MRRLVLQAGPRLVLTIRRPASVSEPSRATYLLIAAAGLCAVLAAIFFSAESEDVQQQRDYDACVAEHRAEYDAGESLIKPEDYCSIGRD